MIRKLKCFEPGFHNGPEDFDYLLWSWKDYTIRWAAVFAVFSAIVGFIALFS